MAITLDGTTGITASGSLTTSSTLTTGTGAVYNSIQASTAVASTSGTSIDFTSIPSWVKRITVMLNGVSSNGSSDRILQIGAGSVTTTGYLSSCTVMGSSSLTTSTFTTGFGINRSIASSQVISGAVYLMNISSNTWACSGVTADSSSANTYTAGGSIALSGTLDRIRITAVNGTDTFDAGLINILYE
jgi:hypothetical protein